MKMAAKVYNTTLHNQIDRFCSCVSDHKPVISIIARKLPVAYILLL